MSTNSSDLRGRKKEFSGNPERKNHMRDFCIRKRQCACLVAALLFILAPTLLFAQNNKKKAPPPKTETKKTSGSTSGSGVGPSTGGGTGTAGSGKPKGSGGVRANDPHTHRGSGGGSGHKTDGGKGVVTALPSSVKTTPQPKGAQRSQLKGGDVLQKRGNGKVSDIHNAQRNIDIHHGLNGTTRVSATLSNKSQVVAMRGGHSYVQSTYTHNGHNYAARTYVYNGRTYNRYYSGYPYRGEYLNVYVPGFYYAPYFYGWAYAPWAAPVSYSWGWAGSPWFGYYGAFFAPLPFYPSASFWLTDYMISGDLSAAYQEQQAAGDAPVDQQPSAGTPALTPAVKEMIAKEVKEELALESQEATQNSQNQDSDPNSSGIYRLLNEPRTHVFVVGSPLDVVDSSGNECALSDGDVLNMMLAPKPPETMANLTVLSSKGKRECAQNSTVAVALTDLQEMQNHMRESIDQGLQELQARQGKGGLPAAPPSAMAPGANADIAKDAPAPDPNAAAEVNQQLADAGQAEKEVMAQAQQETAPTSQSPAPVSPPSAGPVTVKAGQSMAEVKALLGEPDTEIDMDPKVIFKYKDKKIIFLGGKVAEVR
jgi:hypothetical protein